MNLSPLLLLALTLPAGPAPLDAAARAKLDRAALSRQAASTSKQAVDRAGGVPAFLLDHAGLSARRERELADAAHEKLARREKLADAPKSAADVFAALVKRLPAQNRPAAFRYSLHVVERADHVAFTTGGGRVYISRALLDAVSADAKRGGAALAFVLARELGHVGIGHTRRGWQRVALEEALAKDVGACAKPGAWRVALQTGIAASGSLVQFLYTRDQEAEADLFALHLCRLAGLDEDAALDGLRVIAALRGSSPKPPSTLAYYLSEAADPLARLRALLMERDGLSDDENMGLFVRDRRTGKLSRAADASVGEGERAIVFVHGMGGGKHSFDAMTSDFAERRELASRTMLVFRYPNNGSLAHAGTFLANEMRRVVKSPDSAMFVCHSAGGLAFRYYAEKRRGGFAHAVLLATPHAGSDLTGLKAVSDVIDFAGGLCASGLSKTITASLPEGKGQVAYDLHSDSLFLAHLGRDAELAKRYHVVAGEYLTTVQALSLRISFAAAKRYAEPHTGKLDVEIPAEVTRGDLIVTVRSATLPGAGRASRLALRHAAMKSDPAAVRLVAESLAAPGAKR